MSRLKRHTGKGKARTDVVLFLSFIASIKNVTCRMSALSNDNTTVQYVPFVKFYWNKKIFLQINRYLELTFYHVQQCSSWWVRLLQTMLCFGFVEGKVIGLPTVNIYFKAAMVHFSKWWNCNNFLIQISGWPSWVGRNPVETCVVIEATRLVYSRR
jgi:hypothetical protein